MKGQVPGFNSRVYPESAEEESLGTDFEEHQDDETISDDEMNGVDDTVEPVDVEREGMSSSDEEMNEFFNFIRSSSLGDISEGDVLCEDTATGLLVDRDVFLRQGIPLPDWTERGDNRAEIEDLSKLMTSDVVHDEELPEADSL